MLERIQDGPTQAVALKASGTVMASDVEQAAAALATGPAPIGLVIVIDPDFDGYMAEVARGLANVSLAHKTIVRIAVVLDPGQMSESGFSVSAVPIRTFATGDRREAFAWADGASRGQ